MLAPVLKGRKCSEAPMGIGKWLFSGRIRRLERAQEAAVLLAKGRLEEAEDRLDMARPPRFSEDWGVYHFVRARLLMARGQWWDALVHLEAARLLGLSRPTVELHLALVLARLGRVVEAEELLSNLGVDGTEEVQAQARALREQLGAILSGRAVRALEREAADAAKRILPDWKAIQAGEPRGIREAVDWLEDHLPGDHEAAALTLGWCLSRFPGAGWIVGLEPRDHGVTVLGVSVWPARLVEAFSKGLRPHLLPEKLRDGLVGN